MSIFFRSFLVVVVLIGANCVQSAENNMRLTRMLPNDTLAFVSFKDVPQLTKQWNQLGFRSPLANPALQAVISRVEEHFPQPWLGADFDWNKLLTLPTGEACIAIVEATPGKPSIVIALEVRGHHKEATAFFDLLGQGTPPKQNPPHTETSDKTDIIQLSSLSYFLKDDLLVVATDPEIAQELLRSWPGSNGIIESINYSAVMKQCQTGAEKVEPDIFCFLKPIQLLSARMTLPKPKPLMSWQDYLKQAKTIGFDAIRGIGGVCWFDHDSHALLYRVGIYAPDRKGWAMETLRMPNRQEHVPPLWVPQDVQGFTDFYWEMRPAFDSFCKVLDYGIGDYGEEGLVEDILEMLRDEVDGPGIDIRKAFVQRLGEHVLVFRGAKKSGESGWDHTVVGFKITDEAAVEKSLKKYIGVSTIPSATNNPIAVIEHKVGENVFYEVKAEERAAAVKGKRLPVDVELPSFTPPKQQGTSRQSKRRRIDRKRADRPIFLCVAHEYLLWGNDGDLMKSLLTAAPPLAKNASYTAVQRELDQISTNPTSFRGFSRRGDDFALLARCMDAQKFYTPFYLEAQENDESEAAAGRKKVPALSATKATLGPAGWFTESLSDGWRIVGLVLKPLAVQSGVQR